MTDAKSISPLKLAAGAVAAAIALNIVARVFLKFSGAPVAIVIAGVVPVLVLLWLVKVVRQKPTPAELSHFVVLYSAILGGLAALAVCLAYANDSLNAGGAVVLAVHYLAYPLFARLTLSPKQIEHAFKS